MYKHCHEKSCLQYMNNKGADHRPSDKSIIKLSFIIIGIYSISVFVKMLKVLLNNREITLYSKTAIKANYVDK